MSTVLVRSAEELALAENREERDAAMSDLTNKASWRNLALAIQMGIDERPLAGAIGIRRNRNFRLAAAFTEIPPANAHVSECSKCTSGCTSKCPQPSLFHEEPKR